VTNRLDVISQHGIVNKAGGTDAVDQLNLAVKTSAGSDEIALQNSTIKYVSDGAAENLVYVNRTANASNGGVEDIQQTNVSNLASGEFTVVDKNDNGDSYPVLDEESDRFEIIINASNVEGPESSGLESGDSVELELTTRSGGTTNVVLSVPHQLEGEEDDDPIPL
jgi:flagellin FlaB